MDMQLRTHERAQQDEQAWVTPSVEVICLACEISAYAPDQDGPLF
jgi:hypothetical protein